MSLAPTAAETGAWVRRYHPAPDAGTRLICFPHAGGSATYYLPVSKALSPEIDVLAIQYPGRQDRRTEPCIEDVRTLADLVCEQLQPWLDRPFALFGHSMGATLAFEVAARLARSNTEPVVLFASGRRAPSRHRAEAVHLMDDDALIANVRRLSGTAPQLLQDDELLRMILPSIRSDYRAIETYRYQQTPKLSCPIVVLTGDQDPQVTRAEADAWSDHTTAAFDLRVFDGGHFFLDKHSHQVMATIRERLARR